jgi:hypothetical protein
MNVLRKKVAVQYLHTIDFSRRFGRKRGKKPQFPSARCSDAAKLHARQPLRQTAPSIIATRTRVAPATRT